MSCYMKIYPLGAELYHVDRDEQTDGQTDRHEDESRYSQFYERV
jgi:hypothetical protein